MEFLHYPLQYFGALSTFDCYAMEDRVKHDF